MHDQQYYEALVWALMFERQDAKNQLEEMGEEWLVN